ncbi:hypothetical protein MKZ38_010005 [Zalerion maritima]|uniref:PD-(D/E)XK nuclease-like domain-containing protein n=1 Tax=Zalerion maritima TaxID=339359 RepID=A0AAD5WN08_9PEZI|nr:hypothetical protein MKZ38_010005 [Zalerion maritima]
MYWDRDRILSWACTPLSSGARERQPLPSPLILFYNQLPSPPSTGPLSGGHKRRRRGSMAQLPQTPAKKFKGPAGGAVSIQDDGYIDDYNDRTPRANERTRTPRSLRKRKPGSQTLGRALDSALVPQYTRLDWNAPESLRTLAADLRRINSRPGFVWPELRAQVKQIGQKDPLFDELRDRHSAWYYRPLRQRSNETSSSSSDEEEQGANNNSDPNKNERSTTKQAPITPLGPCPSISQLRRILDSAWDADRNLVSEAQWNCAVHYPLLDMALEGLRDGLRLDNCTYATILKEYLPGAGGTVFHSSSSSDISLSSSNNTSRNEPALYAAQSKKIDFCISLENRRQHPGIAYVRESLRQPINQTAYAPLSSCPVAISIETKGLAPNDAQARYQISTWLSAQFLRLEALVRGQWAWKFTSQQRQEQQQQKEKKSEQPPIHKTSTSAWADALGRLGFLPAITILGHNWYFTAVTWPAPREAINVSGSSGGEGMGVAGAEEGCLPEVAKIWEPLEIGSTRTPEQVCQILWNVRRILQWAEDEYWPWLERWAFDIHEP